MTRKKYLVKFIKKFYLRINRLIEQNLNKLKSINFHKVTKNNKFFLSLAIVFVLFLSYLSLPNTYNESEIRIKLINQLQKKFNYSFNLSENFSYNFLPRPHFIYRNSYLSDNQNKISKIGELKVFISLKNLFSYKNFEVRDLIIEKSNFNLDNRTYNFFTKLLDVDFKDGNLTIKNSNIFYKNKDDEVLFINKILNMEYLYDNKSLQNKLIAKNEIFNLPYLIELNIDNIDKKLFSKLNLDFFKLKIDNELDSSNEFKKGIMNFASYKDKLRIKYSINKNNLTFNLSDSLENSNLSYEGEVNFKPFYLNLEGTIEEINILYLLNPNTLTLQLLKTEILNNKNLDINLNIYGNKFQNFNDFVKIYLNSKIQEGLVDLDNTEFSWRDNADFSIEDSLIYVKEDELLFDGKLNIKIKNSDEVYKFLLTPKIYRNELTNIKANFIYNFDQKKASLSNILINNKNYKEIDRTLESLMFKKNKLQNRVYLKSVLNRALKFYAG